MTAAFRALLWLLIFTFVSSSINEQERVFLSAPNADSARQNLRFITSQPHVAGTQGDFVMSAFVQEKLEAAGIPNVSIFNMDVLLNYPQSPPQVSLVVSKHNRTILAKAKLSEDVLETDDTSDTYWRNHTFHGYSPSGTVTDAPLVYANYGRPQDFEALENAGITVKGAVVMVRYGECFRGLKVMNAQERGALAVIIYSDPADDGFGLGDVYPKGPWRPSSGVQRGSVQFNSKCAGDPLRADVRYGNKTVSDICGVSSFAELIPSIQSVPMSYGDALPFLKLLGGKTAKEVGGDDFVGGLNIEYTVGPSDAVVRLQVDNREEIGTIPNVVGHIPGSLPPEQDMPILLGNHRDAWVYGAADPNSGTASLLEVGNGLGALLKTGWKPKRSIYLLSWSGEEYGLLGSTGWAELNLDKITRAAAYLNVDTVVSGDVLSVALTPSLATVWERVLDDISASTEHSMSFANGPIGEICDANSNRILNRDYPDEKMLGSGSDYTVFLDHLGIASVDFSFRKSTSTYGQYHSIYDSFAWMDAYGGIDGKPGSAFDLMAFASKVWGILALRLADTELIPFDHVVQGRALTQYQKAIAEQQVSLDLSNLQQAIKDYQKAAFDLHSGCESKSVDIKDCNEKLGLTERQFLDEEGLPSRPWFKHVLQAPGMYLGYAAEAFPGIQQAIEMDDSDLAQSQVEVAAARIQAAASFMSGGLESHDRKNDLTKDELST